MVHLSVRRRDISISLASSKANSAVSSGPGTFLQYPANPYLNMIPLPTYSYVDCKPSGPDFLTPTNRVRDTLEQIDIAKLMIDRYDDVFEFATTAQAVRDAIRHGKVASLLGVEG